MSDERARYHHADTHPVPPRWPKAVPALPRGAAVVGAAQPRRDLLGLLAEVGRRHVVAEVRVTEADRVADHRHRPVSFADLDPRGEAERLGQLDPLTDRVDRAARHTG